MTIKKKYLWIEKIIDTCWPTLKTDQNLTYTSRCLKEEISHKMCWIFHETLPIWLPIRCPLKKIVYASWSWKVLKICLRASKRLLILSDLVRCCENFWSLGRYFDLYFVSLKNTSTPSHWLKIVDTRWSHVTVWCHIKKQRWRRLSPVSNASFVMTK